MSLYELKEQKLDKLIDNVSKSIRVNIENKKHNLELTINKLRLANPIAIIVSKQNKIKDLKVQLNNVIDKKILLTKHNLEYIINTLKLVNPLNILSSGYSIVRLNDKVITSIKDIKLKSKVNIKLYDGEIEAKVEEIKK